MSDYPHLIAEQHGPVAVIRLDRPAALNALCSELMQSLGRALADFDRRDDIGAMILTGSDKAFAAGADIREMLERDFADVFNRDFITAEWEVILTVRKPVIAAVAGYALGGGCELAMMCDFILAADNARFGQPEITIGTIPGAGGTQRLTRLVGRSKAMEMILTGRMMDAAEAERAGLVSRVVPLAELMDDALKTATKIAGFSRPVTLMAKEAVHIADNTPLDQGLMFERRLFHSSFALRDRREGMTAFIEKRPADFTNC